MHIRFEALNEHGSIIIVGLLILALLSLLGLAATTKSQTDISIAGNAKELEGSLYAAEIALVFAETSIPDLDPFKKLNEENVIGHFGVGDKKITEYIMPKNKQIDWSTDTLEVDDSQMPKEWKKNMSSNPRYILKKFEFVPDCDTLGSDSCGNTGIDVYKVVATGKGGSNKTSTMLETTFHWRHR
jgi:type IV pilus assembly protein PilX